MKFGMVLSVVTLEMVAGVMSAHAGLPAHWVDAGKDAESSLMSSFGAWSGRSTPESRSEAAAELDRYIDASGALANEGRISAKSPRPWYLQSMKAEIGVEAGGEIGFVGLEGEAALELIWKRTPEAVARLKKEYQEKQGGGVSLARAESDVEGDADIVIEPGTSAVALESEVASVVEALGQDGRIKNLGAVRQGILARAREVQPVVNALMSSPADWRFRPYKFQLELFVQAEGKVAPVVEVGAVTRVRLEWPLEFKSKSAASGASVRLAGLDPLVREMDRLAALREMRGSEVGADSFLFYGFKAGVGLGGELELGVAELKGHAMGSVFFKYQRDIKPTPLVLAPASAPLAQVADGQVNWVPFDRLARGVERAFEITEAVTTRAARHERKAREKGKMREFELGAVEVELELSGNGNLVLAGVSKKTAVELFFSRGGAGSN